MNDHLQEPDEIPSPALRVQGLDFRFKDQVILEDINFCIAPSEFVGVIGPNGAGKTTLFKLILGFLKPYSGTIEIFGRSPIAARSELGYVPQFASFRRNFPISVIDTVLSGCVAPGNWIGKHGKEDIENANSIMDQLHIIHIAKKSLSTISGGEMQRVLLARALVAKPRILLLDEPTANVDSYREEEVFELIAQSTPLPAILLISHDLGFITPRVSRVACLHRTMSIHLPERMSPDTIEKLYGRPVHVVHHNH